MKRVEFRLSMPGANTASGSWSGAGKDYLVVKTLTDKIALNLLGERGTRSWSYAWSDGWVAQVSARILPPGGKSVKSAGFAGYDWMVSSILAYGEIRHG
jgi:hypothetical protein